MTLIIDVLNKVLGEITPTARELKLINSVIDKVKNFLQIKAKELNVNFTKIEPQGSTGIKQTQLRGDFDIDVFVGLDYENYEPKYRGLSKNKLKKESKKDFLELCNNWIIKSLPPKEFHNPRLLYAEHPYVTVDYLSADIKTKIDIVLYFDLDLNYIKNYGPITAVDRSPWHGRFIKDELTPKQKDEVRLLKQFFKACHSYGDKSAVGKVGFIGYSAELLIFYYKTILNLFHDFDNLWKKPLDYYNRNIKELGKVFHFQNDYLLIIDPIDKNRNVASAISERAYKYCNQKIKEFMKDPKIDYFNIVPIPDIYLSNLNDPILSKFFIVELKNKNKDVHYTINRDKLYSLGESIKSNGETEFTHAERFGKIEFEVFHEDENDEYNLALYCDKSEISKTYFRKGPPIKEKSHAEKFKKKNPHYFEKDNLLWVESEREYTEFLEFLKDFINDRVAENLVPINISKSFNVKTASGKKAIYVLKNMVLPFCL